MDVRLSAAEQAEIWDRYEAGQLKAPKPRSRCSVPASPQIPGSVQRDRGFTFHPSGIE